MSRPPASGPNTQSPQVAALRVVAVAAALAAIVYLVHALLAYSLPQLTDTDGFALMRTRRIPVFYDLRWNLAITECPVPFEQLARSGSRCHGFPWTGYPYLAFDLGKWLGLGVKDLHWIGLISGLALIATLAHQVWLLTSDIKSWSVLTVLSLLSFPSQLLLERSNMDVILYVLISLFCLLLWTPRPIATLTSNLLGALLTAFKIYPFFGIVAWASAALIRPRLPRASLWLPWSLIATQLIVLIAVMATLESKMLVKEGGLGSHGLLALGYANLPLISSYGIAKARLLIKFLFGVKSLALIAGFAVGLQLFRNSGLSSATLHQRSTMSRAYAATVLTVMTAIGISGYIVTINFDYRLFFLAPMLALLAENLISNCALTKAQRGYILLLLACATYVAYLPFVFTSPAVGYPFIFELVDEMFAAPFCLSGLAAILLIQILRPDRAAHPPIQPAQGA